MDSPWQRPMQSRPLQDAGVAREGRPKFPAPPRASSPGRAVERRASRNDIMTTESADGAELRKWLIRNAAAHAKSRSELSTRCPSGREKHCADLRNEQIQGIPADDAPLST